MKKQSAWDRGVKLYKEELLELLQENKEEPTIENMLNGASSWLESSSGGCWLVHDSAIAARLCSPSELKKTKGGTVPPSARESWLDVQACALRQAAALIVSDSRKNIGE